MTEKELYKRALKDWGKEPQMMQVIEEMAELTKEILKNINLSVVTVLSRKLPIIKPRKLK